MMGHHSGNQDRLLRAFNIGDHAPNNHLLCGIDRFLDRSELHPHLSPYCSHTGQPSIGTGVLIFQHAATGA